MHVYPLLRLAGIYTDSMTGTHFAYSSLDTPPYRLLHPRSLPTYSSIRPPSTLNFLERSRFTSRHREEKRAFMNGLVSVLERFSEGLWARKVLPELLEAVGRSPILEHGQGFILLQMKDPHLLPSIHPDIFAISTSLSPSQFALQVPPSLKPLFAVQEPPQNMTTLLDNGSPSGSVSGLSRVYQCLAIGKVQGRSTWFFGAISESKPTLHLVQDSAPELTNAFPLRSIEQGETQALKCGLEAASRDRLRPWLLLSRLVSRPPLVVTYQ